MVNTTHHMTLRGRRPPLRAIFYEADGRTPVNLTGHTVLFSRYNSDGSAAFEKPATIVDALAGSVVYLWVAGDITARGVFPGRFICTDEQGQPYDVPNDGFINIVVS